MESNRIDKRKKTIKKDYRLIDEAWDEFADYIGEHKLKTPLTLEQFEKIFNEINKNKNGKYTEMKEFILQSFQYDSYSWPLVERNKR